MESQYPAHWEADVLLLDGGAARLRPIRPDDAERLVAFYERVSPESKYMRFFAPYPTLSARDVDRFVNVDYLDRVAFVVTVADEIIAVGRYDKLEDAEAEVAFLVEDRHQGRGLAQLLLEHLAQAGRERGFTKFIAEVLPDNARMIQTFRDFGYHVEGGYQDGVLRLVFPIEATDTVGRRDALARAPGRGALDGALLRGRERGDHRGEPAPGHDRLVAGAQPGARRLLRTGVRREPGRGRGGGHAGVQEREGRPRPGRPRRRRRPGRRGPRGRARLRRQGRARPGRGLERLRRDRARGTPAAAAAGRRWPGRTGCGWSDRTASG